MALSGRTTPNFVQLAAHPLRWQLLIALAGSDHRVRELTGLVGQPQNLVSYHLRLLRQSGLVTSRRSSFDGRDSYYHLDLDGCAEALAAAGAALHPALTSVRFFAQKPGILPPSTTGPASRPRVLFICTGNSSRSPIAEALLRHHSDGHVEVTSAGSDPEQHIHPNAVRALRKRYGIDVTDQRPRHVDTVVHLRFDHVISLCDKVREVCPDFPSQPRLAHWSISDPAAGDPDQDNYPAFERAVEEIDTRIRSLLAVLVRIPHQEVRS